jgi:hypothetical protein
MGVFQNNLLAGAAAAATAGGGGFYSHQIEQSARFDRADDSRLTRTFGTASSLKKFTISFWLKRAQLGAAISGDTYAFMSIMNKTTGNYDGNAAAIIFDSGSHVDKFGLYRLPAGSSTLRSDNLFRDTGGWNHLVVRADTTQSTASDRLLMYLNGNQLTTNTPTAGYLSQDADYSTFATADVHYIGTNASASGMGFDGYLAEFIFTDGQSYAPTQFGETKNGVWIPKNPSGTTFGNNGFHLKFENASDLGNDSSGNNNDFSVTNMGADHQSIDTPTLGTG